MIIKFFYLVGSAKLPKGVYFDLFFNLFYFFNGRPTRDLRKYFTDLHQFFGIGRTMKDLIRSDDVLRSPKGRCHGNQFKTQKNDAHDRSVKTTRPYGTDPNRLSQGNKRRLTSVLDPLIASYSGVLLSMPTTLRTLCSCSMLCYLSSSYTVYFPPAIENLSVLSLSLFFPRHYTGLRDLTLLTVTVDS